jgi:hypothetical protein
MEEIITFDPTTEFQILETFDFEEETARGESVRFFTLEEQLNDYFELKAPKGKMTRFEMKELASQVDRIKDAYTEVVELTDTEYTVRPSRKVRMPSWVHPLVDEYSLNEYMYGKSWSSLYGEQFLLPNYYPRMISALPKPYATDPSDMSVPLTQSTRGYVQVGEAYKTVSALGNYVRTRSVAHEDGTRDVQDLPMPNTADNLRIKGYVLDPRKLELPNPLPDHAFLASNEARKLETIEPFEDVYPTVDAILNHAVPVTSDPYGEGMKYLKLYDVKLREIPWSAWKSRFPPADEQQPISTAASVSFPAAAVTLPSENLRNVYSIPFREGVHPRLWLTQQEDAGVMVERMLLSRAGDSGRVPVIPVGELLEYQFPESTPEECLKYDTFDAFVASGVYRNKKCLPPGAIAQERAELVSKGRKAWNDNMDNDILKEHVLLLKRAQPPQRQVVEPVYKSVPARGESELRRQIKVVLKDRRRLEEDKADAIDLLLQNTPPTQNVFLDPEGGFLVCGHTIAVLRGSMIKDLNAFYRDWTAIETGKRVCKSCGESVATVFVQQDEFDDDGRVMINYGALDDQPSVRGEAQTDSLTLGLRELHATFATDNASETILYTLLSILQVLPTNEQLLPILQTVRKMSSSLHKANKGADFTNRADGIIGLMGAVLLIQINLLVPRRTFGSRALNMSGFPRDTDDSKTKGVLDSLIFVLRTTFEAFPTSFKGVVVPFVRSILTKPADVRKECVTFLTRESVKFKDVLSQGKMRNDASPIEDTDVTLSLPLLQLEKTTYAPTETLPQHQGSRICTALKPSSILVPKNPPVVTQKKLVLDAVTSSPNATGLRAVPQQMVAPLKVAEKDVRDRLKLGMPKQLRLPDLKSFVDETDDGYALQAAFQRILDLVALNATFSKPTLVKFQSVSGRISASPLFRDIMKGYIYEMLHAVAAQPNVSGLEQLIQNAIRTDLTLRCLMMKKAEAEKEQQTLRARERETIKNRLRMMDDTKRELTKTFLDLGIAAYIITAEDREMFAQEKAAEQTPDPLADPTVPEEGMNANRDYEDDVPPVDAAANDMEVDRGDYGDRAVRDYNDYTDAAGNIGDDENYGV